MIVEISLCFCYLKTAGENGRGKIFRACLAIASSNRDYLKRQRLPVVGSELLVRLQGIFDAN